MCNSSGPNYAEAVGNVEVIAFELAPEEAYQFFFLSILAVHIRIALGLTYDLGLNALMRSGIVKCIGVLGRDRCVLDQ